jgi:PAS domain S-box-containing protein
LESRVLERTSELQKSNDQLKIQITERKQAEAALRDSEAWLHTLFHATPSPYLVVIPPDFTITAVNDAYLRATMTDREAIVGRSLFEIFPENPESPSGGVGALRASLEHVVATRRLHEMPVTKYDIPRPAALGGDFEERWWKPRNAPVFGAAGALVSIIHNVEDVTARVRAETALRESEEKYKILFDSIDEGFCTIEVLFDENQRPIDYRFLQVNPSFERQTGIENAAGRRMRDIAPLHEEHWFETYGRIALTGEPVRFINEAAQLGRWYDVYAFRVDDPRHRRVGILFNDITERRRAEQSLRESVQRQAILASELRHRVRNLIAIISSIAARTGETAQSVPQYAEVLGSRLMALARTQSLLSNNSASAVNLASMIRDEVGAHAHHETDYEISGPDVFLPAKAAEVLGLAIHELATNALKYGALSEPDGRVSIHWSVADRDGEPCLTFDWNERRKNYVESPASRRGFGTELVERRVPYELHGTSRLTIDGNGAHCRIEFPLRDGASIFDSTPPQ